MKFIGLTRGGADGVIAIIEIGGRERYYEKLALVSLLKNADEDMRGELEKALHAVDSTSDLEEVPEFESGIPTQPSLFS